MTKPKTNILVLRFSSMGDVAMVEPVVRELLENYPDVEVTIVSQTQFESIFSGEERIQFLGIDLQRYKGFFGLIRLANYIRQKVEYDAIVDLHDVIRTQVIRKFLPHRGIPLAVVGKGRAAKRKLTRRRNKILKPLKLMVQRYADAFAEAGFPFDLHNQLVREERSLNSKVLSVLGPKKSNWIGIAPFARHKSKRLPLEKAEHVIERLSHLPNVKILLFGGGKSEESKLQDIADDYSNVYNVAGKMNLDEELDLISNLDVMLSMDSANMHLASRMGVPVVSVWGGTHPYLGYLGYGQSIIHSVQTDLPCRPCSTFGEKPCYRHDYACMKQIDEQDILIKISNLLTTEQ